MHAVLAEEFEIVTQSFDRGECQRFEVPIQRIIPYGHALGNSAPFLEFLGVCVICGSPTVNGVTRTLFAVQRVVSADELIYVVIEAVGYIDVIARHGLFRRIRGSPVSKHRNPKPGKLLRHDIGHDIGEIEHRRGIRPFRGYCIHTVFAFAEIAAVRLRNIYRREFFSDLKP